MIDYRITLNETNVVKGIAICALLWHHLFFEHPEYGPITFKLSLTCKMCVALFVFLSGYGMATQYQKKYANSIEILLSKRQILLNWGRFLLHRLIKFYLNYWIVFFLVVPLGIFVFSRTLVDAYGSEKPLWISFLLDVLGMQVFKSYNITWWINRLFIVLWLSFPILYWSMRSKAVSGLMLILLYLNPGSILLHLNFLAFGLSSWLLSFALGIFIAVNGNFINRVLNKINRYAVLVFAIVVTIAFLYMRNHYVVHCFLGIKSDPFIAVFLSLAVVCICRLSNRKISILGFVGKHSMNMYLIHTFIFSYFFHDFIYGFKNPCLIFLVLFSTSLLLSLAFETLKKIIGFYRFQTKIINLINV